MTKPKSKLMWMGCDQGKVWSRDGHQGLDQINQMFDMNIDDELTFDW